MFVVCAWAPTLVLTTGSCHTANYIDSTYTAEESHKRYYPTHTEKLTSLKNKYDPRRVINFPQDF